MQVVVVCSDCCFYYSLEKSRRRKTKPKKKSFKSNGGLLLQQDLTSNEGNIEKAKLFILKDLEKPLTTIMTVECLVKVAKALCSSKRNFWIFRSRIFFIKLIYREM